MLLHAHMCILNVEYHLCDWKRSHIVVCVCPIKIFVNFHLFTLLGIHAYSCCHTIFFVTIIIF